MFDKNDYYRGRPKDKRKEEGSRNVKNALDMDPRYWKEFENMGEMEGGKRAGSEEAKSARYRRRSRSRSRSRSSSSSSSGSSSSSSSSRHHSDRSRGSYRKRDGFRRNSPSRATVRSNSYGSVSRGEENSNWFPPPHPGYPPPSSQDLPPSSSFNMPPNQYPQGPPPPVQGQYPPNFQGQNFGNNYFGGYDQPPPNYYPPNFPPPHSGSQPPPNFPMGGGPRPGQGPGPANWDPPMFPDNPMLPPPIIPGDGMPGPPPPMGGPDKKCEEARKEAIEQELLQQKRTLSKQREDYIRRKFSLNRELSRLKDQKRELHKEKSKDNERILRENAKLQGEIQQKLKSIDNVIEMLTNIIGDGTVLPDIIKEIKLVEKEKAEKIEEKSKKAEKEKKKHSPERNESRKRSESIETESTLGKDFSGKNLVYYDPGLHWCADCNIFPKTVTDYLQHLQSEEHSKNAKMKFEDYPWHSSQNREKSPVFNKDLPTKRIPIRGVQFLIPATAWFCSMCKVWLGDNHCASRHVQNAQHSQNYSDFIAKNPHWEVDWLTERTRSYEKKSEAKHQAETLAAAPTSTSSVTLESLSDQLLAIIANKNHDQPPQPPAPPPPPAIHKSSSSSEDDDSPDGKAKKKRKKLKSKKKSKESRSSSKEKTVFLPDQIKLNYNKSIPERRPDPTPVDDNFISEWMPRVEAREIVPLKKKPKIDNEKLKKKSESQERSMEHDLYNDHDDAVVFDKRAHHSERESKNKRKYEEDKYERHSKYEKGSPKDKFSKYKSDKYKPEREDDYRPRKDSRYQRENERDRMKKSPFSKMKDTVEKKKIKNKAEKTSDDDIHETAFEKRSSESAAKKKIDGKKIVLNNLPKTKLPFIGRMPILKKKVEQKPEDKEDKKDNDEGKDISDTLIPTETLPVETGTTTIDQTIEELPKSTLIISKRPRLPEPGIVKKEILFNKPVNDNFTEQDMELDDEAVIVVPPAKEEEPAKDELHKDFKDALDLLFPEEKKKEQGDDTEKKEESEITVEAQPAAIPAGYVLPPGYDPTATIYPPYYDQQAYVQQQWVQMGYEQPAQYQGPYAFPSPVIEGPPVKADPPPEPELKKKKNRPSQRMRRHLLKKKIKEMEEGKAKSGDETTMDESDNDDLPENEEEDKSSPEDNDPKPEPLKPPTEMSDLAMLGIDEDDAAAMGFY